MIATDFKQNRRLRVVLWMMAFVLIASAFAFSAGKKASKVDKEAKETFEARCAGCHGPDGSGTALGKSLQAADLRSAEVQNKPDTELIDAATNGKGNMPPFKDKLSNQEIQSLITYVRTLAPAPEKAK